MKAPPDMASGQNDLPKFSIAGRIVMVVVAVAMIAWMLRLSGVI